MEYIVTLIMMMIAICAGYFTKNYVVTCILLCVIIVGHLVFSRVKEVKREKYIDEIIDYLMKLQDGLELPELSNYREGNIGILQNEIYKLVNILKEKNDRDKKEKKYMSAMMSDISHQIKTPITAISVMTELLEDENLPQVKREEYIKNIDTQVNKVTWLIRNMLTLSQLEADMLHLKKDNILVSDLIADAVKPLEILAEVKGVNLNIKNIEGLSIVCDKAWTSEAISNIVKNCIEHTNSDGYVNITISNNNFSTNIEIKDSGSGIDKDDLPHIFERFYKAKNASKNSVGIGLAMAKQIIMLQNGIIDVNSEVGVGTEFIIKMYENR